MAGLRDTGSKIVKVEWGLNWLTFVFARFIAHMLITVRLVRDAPKFEKGMELPLALSGMAGMNLLNIFLGIDLVKAYGRERRSQKERRNHQE